MEDINFRKKRSCDICQVNSLKKINNNDINIKNYSILCRRYKEKPLKTLQEINGYIYIYVCVCVCVCVERDRTYKYNACTKFGVFDIRPLTDGKYIYHFVLNGQCHTIREL